MYFRRSFLGAACAGILLAGTASAWGAVIQDIFGRDLSTYGLVVPDWEGYMGNPAIEFLIAAPPGATPPVKVTLAANDPRLYFDLPSTAGAQGPRKELTLSGTAPASVHISVFPARKKQNAEKQLAIAMIDARGRKWQSNLPVHEIAVESRDASLTHHIIADFSQDTTGFYKDSTHRAAFEQAVADWSYYLADLHVDPTPAGSEKTWIFDTATFTKGHRITNEKEYTGTLLYSYGISTPETRSGGEPSQAGALATQNGTTLPLHRSGGVEVEIRGNYKSRGWVAVLRDDEWWRATMLGGVPADLYSVMHHEMGHALFFNPANKNFTRNGVLHNDAVRAYLGTDARTDTHDHFDGIVDPVSLHGAYGNEYHGKTPNGRWLITRFDLLCAQAIGYKLRKTAPFVDLAVVTDSLPAAAQGKPYKTRLEAEGGVPFYDWTIAASTLPVGLTLNRFTGEIVGTPRKAGTSEITIQVRDYQKDGKPAQKQLKLDTK
ncbi:MAG TPA: Ig domain-containing protein [Tepidisphaeraceae bacterium]|jgi:hypothetical protein